MVEHDLTPYDDHIDHFTIYHANNTLSPYSTEFQMAYGSEVERLMIPWIREEERSGRLKDRAQWRPFRDSEWEEESIMGYHRMFVYYPTRCPTRLPQIGRASFGPEEVPCVDGSTPHLVRVYFMLGIMNVCRKFTDYDCAVCEEDTSTPYTPHFMAALYGWEEDDTPHLKPYAHFTHCKKKETVNLDIPVVPTEFWDVFDDDDSPYVHISYAQDEETNRT